MNSFKMNPSCGCGGYGGSCGCSRNPVGALQNPSGLALGLVGLLVLGGGGAAWYFLAGPGAAGSGAAGSGASAKERLKGDFKALEAQVDNPTKVYADGRKETITKAEGIKLVATGQWRYGESLRRTVVEGPAVTSGQTGKGMRYGKGALKKS